ncbi:MAG: DNA repair protein RecN [Lachnospiraceae bacterium]|nr:DNA repair protein RecN [Lachnospiraceae bacterium]
MLQSLHVKNLALMEETEVVFEEGLNILTGETGAGKSLLIGSVNLALGAKFDKDMLRKGADSALVELVFQVEDDQVTDTLRKMDLEADSEGTVILTRKMQVGKSIFKINGETVTAKQVKELAEVLIDIHGQHEHQSLLHKKKHLEILDAYAGEALAAPKAEVARLYSVCKELKSKLDQETLDEGQKSREQALAEFELQEITDAALTLGEDEELDRKYRIMVNGQKITEGLAECHMLTGNESQMGAAGSLGRALRALRNVAGYDKQLEQLEAQLADIENLLSDFNRDVMAYLDDYEFDGAQFQAVESRLNQINRLKDKYGATIEEILAYGASRQELLDKLNDYDAYIEELEAQLCKQQEALEAACAKVSAIRSQNAAYLEKALQESLDNLNFLTVKFKIQVQAKQNITTGGYDEVEFLISTNPGEEVKPLGQVASGGELSRVMLAIKTVLAERDAIDTLIFDEIDAGISGKTAWKVAGQLNQVARAHQVLCITHLPQIAAMADAHYVIEKCTSDGHTITDVRRLKEQDSTAELARLLGSDTLTDAALKNAEEMRLQALTLKS